mmetsp:Transcript_9663/g.29349  ORF Transcript_9663/g.29349 Transcript_9663/m.29349 type:complete len:222 (+) Transcript_9663:3533-4198(+)
MALVVFVDVLNGDDAWVLLWGVLLGSGSLLVPVEDPAHEGGDELCTVLCGHGRLRQREHKRHVAVDAVLLEYFTGLESLPCARKLDEDPLFRNSDLLVHLEELVSLFDAALRIEAQPSVDLGRYVSWHNLGDFGSKQGGQLVSSNDELRILGRRALLCVRNRFRNQSRVLLHACSLVDQRRVGRRIHGFVLADCLNVSRVLHDDGVLLQLLQLRDFLCCHG